MQDYLATGAKYITAKEVKFLCVINHHLIESIIIEESGDSKDIVQWFQVMDTFNNILKDHKIIPDDIIREYHINKETQHCILTDSEGRFFYGKQ